MPSGYQEAAAMVIQAVLCAVDTCDWIEMEKVFLTAHCGTKSLKTSILVNLEILSYRKTAHVKDHFKQNSSVCRILRDPSGIS